MSIFDTRQSHIEALMFDSESLVINAQQVQHGRVQIANVNNVFHGIVSQFIGGAPGCSPLTPPPAIHIEKPFMWWSRPAPPLP